MANQVLTLQDFQKAHVVASPVDAAGQPAISVPPLSWTIDNAAVATLGFPSPGDNLQNDVFAVAVGTATVTVSGVAGGVTYAQSFTVNVVPGVPVGFLFTFGAPTAK